ncbi:MAG: choline dehydrogenase [Rhodobacterales bacterium]|nr:choline dehydrogenase [Rhodobacterales bacterium]
MNTDYVIVGAGSAGCAIAFRLTEAGHKVTILEFGGHDRSPLIQMPAALSYPMNMERYDWGYWSEPEPHLGGRKLACPRGKVIGGSSSINGMVYVRGHAKDFDTWAEMGASGWSYSDILPYYRRLENVDYTDSEEVENLRGVNGPLNITKGKRMNPLTLAFEKAGAQAGYQSTPDYNGNQQEGFGPMDQTIKNGLRWSSAKAYLKPAIQSGNCQVIRGLATKIIIENSQATGVEYTQGNKKSVLSASKEVIISASSINSPKLLLLSGIGPAAELKSKGITVVANRPGVGKNLQDHLELYIQMASKKPVSLYKYWNPVGKAWVGLRWFISKSGPGASNQFESAAFIRSKAGVEYPDIQYHFLPLAVRYDGKLPVKGHGFQAHVGPMRSQSRGYVTLRSSDPKEPPKIQFNYMSHESDWIDFRNCIRLTREIFSQPAFEPFAKSEISPGKEIQSDDQLNDFIRDNVESAYHPCGTCKMGDKSDPMSVVDPETRVIGVDKLRVADSSIFPQITNGNLNAPSIMVGEKASDHILGKDLLPRSNEMPWIHPDWHTSQR